MIRKKPFLLFEILVALSLMATLVSVLFSFMVQSMSVEEKIERARKCILERQSLQIRFQDLLTTLAPHSGGPPLYTIPFSSKEPMSLIATFDNGIDPDPSFSGIVTARIYVDENKNLCLVYWPLDYAQGNRSWRKEILLSNVTDFSFNFLKLDPKKNSVIWDSSWAKSNLQPPSLIRMSCKQNDEILQFAFHLGYSHPIPTWSSPT